jgi:hypothetical protein
MRLDIQPWLTLPTIGLTITICFGIVSIMKGLSHSKDRGARPVGRLFSMPDTNDRVSQL